MKNRTVFIGADHRGYGLKTQIIGFLKELNCEVKDQGVHSGHKPCDYPKISLAVAKKVAGNKNSRGILVCLSGIGPTIAANKVRGAYAALCYNRKAAQLARSHNNSNILVLGAGFVSAKDMKGIIKTWLTTEFEGGRHLRRVRQIKAIERIKKG